MSTSDSKSCLGKSLMLLLIIMIAFTVHSKIQGTALSDYINFIHLNFLSKICVESGFKGLAYCGGPEVTCKKLNELTVLPCVIYNSKTDFSQNPNLKPQCPLCKEKYENINNLEQVSYELPAWIYTSWFILCAQDSPATSSTCNAQHTTGMS